MSAQGKQDRKGRAIPHPATRKKTEKKKSPKQKAPHTITRKNRLTKKTQKETQKKDEQKGAAQAGGLSSFVETLRKHNLKKNGAVEGRP